MEGKRGRQEQAGPWTETWRGTIAATLFPTRNPTHLGDGGTAAETSLESLLGKHRTLPVEKKDGSDHLGAYFIKIWNIKMARYNTKMKLISITAWKSMMKGDIYQANSKEFIFLCWWRLLLDINKNLFFFFFWGIVEGSIFEALKTLSIHTRILSSLGGGGNPFHSSYERNRNCRQW